MLLGLWGPLSNKIFLFELCEFTCQLVNAYTRKKNLILHLFVFAIKLSQIYCGLLHFVFDNEFNIPIIIIMYSYFLKSLMLLISFIRKYLILFLAPTKLCFCLNP